METAARQKKTVHVFDVDGTLTRNDSLLLLIQYERPTAWKRLCLWLSVLPVVPTALLKNDRGMIKQVLLKQLWAGKSRAALDKTGQSFFAEKLQADLRPNALAYINALVQEDLNTKLVLLSASCEEWLQPLADYLQTDLICTELEYAPNDCFTGRFATPNCKGTEKVKRLLQRYPQAEYEFICYADDESDRALQSISKQFFYRYF